MESKTQDCIDDWRWSFTDKSDECLVSQDGREVLFHPECSGGSDCIRANRPLPRDGHQYYWEVTIHERIYGTAVMVGVCNRNQSLTDGRYLSLVGKDNNGWCLTHKGDIWHNRKQIRYTDSYGDNGDQTIGVLYDSANGTLTFYRNNECLGQAFDNLNQTEEDLYPVIGSTALRTSIRLDCAYRNFLSLKDRCRYVAYHRVLKREGIDLSKLQIPNSLLQYIHELSPSIYMPENLTKKDNNSYELNDSLKNYRTTVDAVRNSLALLKKETRFPIK